MSEKDPIGDGRVVAVLDRAAWGINPVLDLMSTDPLRIKARTFTPTAEQRSLLEKALDAAAWLLDVAEVPGTAAWERASDERRARWWVTRLGALNTIAVAFPGVFGPLARRLPIQDLLAFANQTLVLVAVARELGVTDRSAQVDLLASVLCRRQTDARTLLAHPDATPPEAGSSWRPFALLGAMWTTSRMLRAIPGELGKRPKPGQPYRTIGKLPLVGAVADYFGERGALARAAAQGQRWIDGHTVRTAAGRSGVQGLSSV
ncbi:MULTISPECIES: hypothetical protein [Rhodococcus]|uniref:Uncharacterized protein n=1 Tax=Rhodococcus maanshanensis TaxID=183556 RepID=A0A1H7N461_9NOCA|nr:MULTISPECIES: hypothetical protein [Rhodococcus]SEL18111.1 hypothetical protein SAMN05444583_106238 [Rhodococcus maanshanensis]